MPSPYAYLSPETQTRMKSMFEELTRQGIPAEHVMRYFDENPDQIISSIPPARPNVSMLDSLVGPLLEPSPENLVALPLSFVTGGIAGKLATKFLPNAGIRRLAVRFLADPAARDIEFAAAKQVGLEGAFGSIASINAEKGLLHGLAVSFGMSLPFGVADMVRAAHDDESQAGAFASTVGTFAALDLGLGALGAMGRGVSRLFRSRLSERLFRQTAFGEEMMGKFDDYISMTKALESPSMRNAGAEADLAQAITGNEMADAASRRIGRFVPNQSKRLPGAPGRSGQFGEKTILRRSSLDEPIVGDVLTDPDFGPVFEDFMRVGGNVSLMTPENQAVMAQIARFPALQNKFSMALRERTAPGGLPSVAQAITDTMTTIEAESPAHAAALRAAASDMMTKGMIEDTPAAQTIAAAIRGSGNSADVANLPQSDVIRLLQTFSMSMRDIARLSPDERKAKLVELLDGAQAATEKANPVRSAPKPAVKKLVEALENPGLPDWVREDMARSGKRADRLMNDIDVASHKGLLENDPVIAYIAKTNPELAKRALSGNATRDELLPYAKAQAASSDIKKGTAVTFTNKNGEVVTGKILNVTESLDAAKYVTVEYKDLKTGSRRKETKTLAGVKPVIGAANETEAEAAFAKLHTDLGESARLPRDLKREDAIAPAKKLSWDPPDLVERSVRAPLVAGKPTTRIDRTEVIHHPDTDFYVVGQVYAKSGRDSIEVQNLIFANVKVPEKDLSIPMLVASGTKIELEKLGYVIESTPSTKIIALGGTNYPASKVNLTKAMLRIAEKARRAYALDYKLLDDSFVKRFAAGQVAANEILSKAMPKGMSDKLRDALKRDMSIRAIKNAERRAAVAVTLKEGGVETMAGPDVVPTIMSDAQVQLDIAAVRAAKTIDAETNDLIRRAEVRSKAAAAEKRLAENESFRAVGIDDAVTDNTVNVVAPEEVVADAEWIEKKRASVSKNKAKLDAHPRTLYSRSALTDYKLMASHRPGETLKPELSGLTIEDAANEIHTAIFSDAKAVGLDYIPPLDYNSKWLRGTAKLTHTESQTTFEHSLDDIEGLLKTIDEFDPRNPLLAISASPPMVPKRGRPC